MTVPQRHSIRRTSIRLHLQRTELVAPVRQALQDSFREEILPEISALFDELVPPGKVLRIPKLEIDLGTLPPGAGAAEWRDRCLRALRTAVQAQLSERIREKGVEETFIASEQRTWEAWLFFLTTGRLPWWSPLPDDQWEFELLTLLQSSASEKPAALRKLLRGNAPSIDRLVRQFSPAFLYVLLRSLWPELTKVAEDVKVRTSGASFGPPGSSEANFIRRLLVSALFESPVIAVERYVTIGQKMPARWGESDWETLSRAWDSRPSPLIAGQNNTASGSIPTADTAPDKREENQPNEPEEAAYAIDNAGLVIIAPFFTRLFREMGLVDADEFTSMDARQKGVALLRYLTDGSENAPEYRLILEKLLCGLPTDWPVEREVLLSETEKTACNNLLTATIRYWTALGHCSVPGLQETFLQRKGKISRRSDGQWLLQAERKTVDILLDRLPWGYGVVQMPWMEQRIWVEW